MYTPIDIYLMYVYSHGGAPLGVPLKPQKNNKCQGTDPFFDAPDLLDISAWPGVPKPPNQKGEKVPLGLESAASTGTTTVFFGKKQLLGHAGCDFLGSENTKQ